MPEKIDSGTFAYAMVEHVADKVGDDNTDAYLAEVVDEVFELCPGVRERVLADLLTDLKEEVARCEDPRHARAVVGLIEEIEEQWKGERG